ncbi:MAG: extracellular solute-binding protein [Desulfobacteraceae bacterium]
MVRLILVIILCCLGCKTPDGPVSRQTITYTFDDQTQILIRHLAQEHQIPVYQDFDRRFKGLFIPGNLLPYEPFVLALSTESKIPTVLLLDAPWVRRYATAGWLYEMERTQVFSKEDLIPAVANAFSVSVPQITGRPEPELMAVPTFIKGNILFYRQDLLSRYQQSAPRNWAELKAICQKILPQEPALKYGLIFHVTNFINDFYPVLWGFGGEVLDSQGNLELGRPETLAASIEALEEICAMSGTLAPSTGELKKFEAPRSLRQALYQGEALFMINWNTRMHDLKEMIQQGDQSTRAALTGLNQVGVAPIPCRRGHPHRYSNVGSFGWGVNRFAITDHQIMTMARQFIHLVTNDRFQVLAAETMGQIPALQSALPQIKNQQVWQVYQQTFAAADVVLRPRPQSRLVNNLLEKHLLAALYGQNSPRAALTAASVELKEVVRQE